MSDTSTPQIRYGTPNLEMLGGWFTMGAEQDGAFWALNLMRYRELADYADGRPSTISGREADDAYAPLGPLAAIGALPAFLADVTGQSGAGPSWDRVGIVRYPSRRAFLEMQTREDFKELHVHKDAGMEFTIVMSCLPLRTPRAAGEGSLVLSVWRGEVPVLEHPGVQEMVEFGVEGVIVGDERRWSGARFDHVAGEEALAAVRAAAEGAEEAVVLSLEPLFEDLPGSFEQDHPLPA